MLLTIDEIKDTNNSQEYQIDENIVVSAYSLEHAAKKRDQQWTTEAR
jgi:hypothetical protein